MDVSVGFGLAADDDDGRSVAQGMLEGGLAGNRSAKYRTYTEQLRREVQGMVVSKVDVDAGKQIVVLPVALSSEALARLEDRFPEFRLRNTGTRHGHHPAFLAERQLGLAWCVKYAKKFGPDVVLVGDGLLSAAIAGDERVHVEYDPLSPLSCHADYDAGLDIARMGAFGMDKSLAAIGCCVPPTAYKRFVCQTAYVACKAGGKCTVKAQTVVCDLSMHPMSQLQVAGAMEAAGAGLGVVMLPYCSDMIFQPDGKFVKTGIDYSRRGGHLYFNQPDGEVMVPRFDGGAWFEWLSRTRYATANSHYSAEIVHVRGGFAYVVVTRVAANPTTPVAEVRHTLEFRDDAKQAKVVVAFDMLRSSTADPSLRESWVRTMEVFEQRLYERLYFYGMSLPRDAFAKTGMQSLLKRIYVGDNRVTYGGGFVDVQAPLSVKEAHRLVEIVYARVFVDRFDMATLAVELAEHARGLDWFISMPRLVRAGYILAHVVGRGWDATVGSFYDWAKDLLVWVRGLFGPKRLVAPRVAPMLAVWDFRQAMNVASSKWLSRVVSWRNTSAGYPSLRGYAVGAMVLAKPGGGGSMPQLPAITAGVGVIPGQSECPVDVLVDMHETNTATESVDTFVATVAELDGTTKSVMDKFVYVTGGKGPEWPEIEWPVEDFNEDPLFIDTFAEVHEAIFPGMGRDDFSQDPTSLALDPQDNHLDPEYLRLPVVDPVSRTPATEVYKSKVKAYAVERRFESVPELLHSLSVRNMAPAQIAEPQALVTAVPDAWNLFLDTACVPDARQRLAEFQADPVSFEDEVLREWAGKQDSARLEKLVAAIARDGRALDEIPLHEYSMMLKADAKPPMSDKPLKQQVAPQTIAFQDKHASACFSSVLRVLTRRFLTLLKPNWLVAILKDVKDVARFITAWFPWESPEGVKSLENDFTKYDKSQGEFCTRLKLHAYEQLGMAHALWKRWKVAQEVAILKSFALGMEMVVTDQQKSGDGGTSFANVLVNVVSVCKAYRGTVVICAVFVGDDSIVLTKKPCVSENSIKLMAEVFNLQSKYFVSSDIYFGSTFYKVDESARMVYPVPDPIKRIQRFAQSRSAKDPKWEEVYEGVVRDCEVYKRTACWKGLEPAVTARYGVPGKEPEVSMLFTGLATAVSSFSRFRSMWESVSQVVYRFG